MAAEEPLTGSTFEALMAPLGPFEAAPRLAVGVSGGADSIALAVLAEDWARARGGRITALTVDHRLRPEAADEAAAVGRQMAGLGIDHRVLTWHGAAPVSGIQIQARQARYALLSDWCRETGFLHLLLAHHRRDQAETVLMRLAGGSGPDGLAAMAAVVETPAVRLLRPLLAIAPERLRATLRDRGLTWIEDPSNLDPAFERTRLRRALPDLAEAGVSEDALAGFAERMGRARAALEDAAALLIGSAVHLHPAGFARVDRQILAAAPAEVSLRALARVLTAVGGRAYGPASAKLERLYARLARDGTDVKSTLAGCRVMSDSRSMLVCREQRGLPQPAPVVAGERLLWDGRFLIDLGSGRGPARLAALGDVSKDAGACASSVPRPARPALPALFDDDGVFAVPSLGYRRPGAVPMELAAIAFHPRSAASGARYFLASQRSRIIP